jgi:hypothetical protein
LAIAVTLFRITVRHASNLETRQWIFFGLCWILPMGLAALPYSTWSYADNGAWCWISSTTIGHVWWWATFYGPLWLAFALLIGLYTAILVNARRTLKQLSIAKKTGARNRLLRRLFAYPLAFVIVWVPPTVERVQELVSDDVNFPLYATLGFFLPLKGFSNTCAAFLFDPAASWLPRPEMRFFSLFPGQLASNFARISTAVRNKYVDILFVNPNVSDSWFR